MGLQAGVSPSGRCSCALNRCRVSAIAKTWDFQRTTSLTSGEITSANCWANRFSLISAAVCVLPITFWAGSPREFPSGPAVGVHRRDCIGRCSWACADFGFPLCSRARSRGIGLIGVLGLYGFVVGTYGFAHVVVPRLGCV